MTNHEAVLKTVFLFTNNDIKFTPVNPSFTYLKVGVQGV